MACIWYLGGYAVSGLYLVFGGCSEWLVFGIWGGVCSEWLVFGIWGGGYAVSGLYLVFGGGVK